MMIMRNKHQRDYGLMDGYFHKNFEFHGSNSLWNKQRQSTFKQSEISLFGKRQYAVSIHVIIGSWVTWLVPRKPRNSCQRKCIKWKEEITIQINEILRVLMTSSRKRHQYDYRLIDGCYHKNLEIHVSSSLSKQKKLVFNETETFMF